MIPTSVILIGSGIVCVGLSAFLMRQISPREGRPRSVWTKTEARAITTALGLMTLFVAGAGFILKGLFA